MRKYTAAIALIALAACTDNERARAYGGSSVTHVKPGQKVVTVTWKNADMWILTRPMRPDEIPETHTFKEHSEFGVWEGTVTLIESPPSR